MEGEELFMRKGVRKKGRRIMDERRGGGSRR